MIAARIKVILRYNANTGEVELDRHSISNSNNKEILGFTFNQTGRVDIHSDIIYSGILNRSRQDIVRGIDKNSILLSKGPVDNYDIRFGTNPFASYFLYYIYGEARKLCKQLINDKIYHVSPLRALPQRYYLLEKSANHKTINPYNGTEVTEVLKNNPHILKLVNDFLESLILVYYP